MRNIVVIKSNLRFVKLNGNINIKLKVNPLLNIKKRSWTLLNTLVRVAEVYVLLFKFNMCINYM
jgi:hypothetical protein